jgi:hypothetical protein
MSGATCGSSFPDIAARIRATVLKALLMNCWRNMAVIPPLKGEVDGRRERSERGQSGGVFIYI